MMPIIQFVMPSRNKQLKKLLHFYWEVCPKSDENRKLKQEMILVVYVGILLPTYPKYCLLISNAIRNYLLGCFSLFHSFILKNTQLLPNEYFQGACFRFLQKLADDSEL